jgi:hypothetical protein
MFSKFLVSIFRQPRNTINCKIVKNVVFYKNNSEPFCTRYIFYSVNLCHCVKKHRIAPNVRTGALAVFWNHNFLVPVRYRYRKYPYPDHYPTLKSISKRNFVNVTRINFDVVDSQSIMFFAMDI